MRALAAFIAVTACSCDPGPSPYASGGPDRSRFVDAGADVVRQPLACEVPQGAPPDGLVPACEGEVFSLVRGLSPRVAADYIGVRKETLEYPGPAYGISLPDGGTGLPGTFGGPVVGAVIEDQIGTPCATASDPVACRIRFDELTLTRERCPPGTQTIYDRFPMHGCATKYLVFTRGDEVGRLSSDAELVSFLAPIDTKEEAFYLLTRTSTYVTGGFFTSCRGAMTRPSADGVEVLVHSMFPGRPPAPDAVFEVLVRVAPDGARSELARRTLCTCCGLE